MRIGCLLALAPLLACVPSVLHSQTQTPAGTDGPAYDVVSVRPNPATDFRTPSNLVQRPDGGFTATNLPVATLISRAYPPAIPVEFVGLPDWGLRERWDVTATSTRPNATADDRMAMLRALLADRFKLVVHVERRPRDVYELILARSDGRLGSGIKPLADVDCVAVRAAAQRARESGAPQPPPTPPRLVPSSTGGPPRVEFSAPPAPCTLMMVGDEVRGQGELKDLVSLFRFSTQRETVDKTGLTGFFEFAMRFAASSRPLEATAVVDAAPTLFTAVQEQLGMKLVPVKVERDTLVIENLERPTEN